MNRVMWAGLRQRLYLLLGLSLLAVSGTGHATVIGGSSRAYGVNANATLDLPLLPDVVLSVGPLPEASGTAPPPYNDNEQVLDLQAGVPGTLSLTASVLDTNAESNVDGLDGVRFASADAAVTDLDFSATALGLLGSFATLSLTADAVGSTAEVQGDYDALIATGDTTLANASLNLEPPLGTFSVALDAMPAPNTIVDVSALGLAGITLILNEQLIGGDGISSRDIMVNAIHLILDVDLLGLAGLSGDIIIGHSDASLTAVSEPATLALMGLGLCGLCWQSRRKMAVSFSLKPSRTGRLNRNTGSAFFLYCIFGKSYKTSNDAVRVSVYSTGESRTNGHR
jgi:hypothetical protein